MLRVLVLGILFAITSPGLVGAQGNAGPISNDEIRQRIIKDSIANYSGPCPCPYNAARNGSRCGARSAYSRPGGQSPLCYPEDISDEMVKRYRARLQ